MRRIKTWEEEKSVLEEGLATLHRAQASYRERLCQVENNLHFCPTDSGHTDSAQVICQIGGIDDSGGSKFERSNSEFGIAQVPFLNVQYI